jgi:dienelactone hydrolase
MLRAETDGQPLDGTSPLAIEGDIAEIVIAGVDRFLLHELEASIARRTTWWRRDTSSASAYQASVEPNRQRLAKIIGLVDPRTRFEDIELVATRSRPALVGRGDGFEVIAVRWPVASGMHGEGLLLEPIGRLPVASIVVLGDCEQSPEALVGLAPGVPAESQLARRLAESGCQVIVPTLISRGHELSAIANGGRQTTVNHREILYRAAYQMGRHLIGYEVQKISAAVDWLAQSAGHRNQPVGVIGYGEGGLLALYAAAVDTRIAVAGVSGYFDSRQKLWQEPIDRNVFGLLHEFGDAEIATLIAPRALVVEACAAPIKTFPPGTSGAPAQLISPSLASVQTELDRAREMLVDLTPKPSIELVVSGDGAGPFGSEPFLRQVLKGLGIDQLAPLGSAPQSLQSEFDSKARLARQIQEVSNFTQALIDDGPRSRKRFLAGLEFNAGIEAFVASAQPYRAYLRDEIIGAFDQSLQPAKPQSRLVYDEPGFRGYKVVLDVFPDVILYGILLVPKNLPASGKLPVVVCQHGLEGRAEFTVEGDHTSYRDVAARLANRGFVTFSPQHLYLGGDKFRTLQRKANPLKKSLFSVMVAQHRQLLNWLGELPFVDRDRIAFYGISYGGKSAMRIPAILDGYCLSICSSDFSDWISRTVSSRYENGYLGHSEYEIFEFNLGSTFNYGDLAALICPRPFMAEQFLPNSAADSASAEFGRVRLLYEQLGIEERASLANYKAFESSSPYVDRETFEFLHQQLSMPRP